jgi:hypothetical protein
VDDVGGPVGFHQILSNGVRPTPGAAPSRNANRWFIAKSESIYVCLSESALAANQLRGSASFIGMRYAPCTTAVSLHAPSSTFAAYRRAKRGVRLTRRSALCHAAVSSHAASAARTEGILVPHSRTLVCMQASMHAHRLSHRLSYARTHAHTCSPARLLAYTCSCAVACARTFPLPCKYAHPCPACRLWTRRDCSAQATHTPPPTHHNANKKHN